MAEVTQCPECQRKLNVPQAHLGQTVQCPVCQTHFTAVVLAPLRPPAPPVVQREPPPRSDDRRRDYDRPPYERSRLDDRGRGRYGDRDPFREVRPHRGGVILVLGLAGLLLCCTVLGGWGFGGAALSMANSDLAQMDRGRVDDAGRGLTQAGRVLGALAIIFASLAAFVICIGLLSDQ
jgi:hypothetical protein